MVASPRWLRVAQREHYLPGSVGRFALALVGPAAAGIRRWRPWPWRPWGSASVPRLAAVAAVVGHRGPRRLDAAGPHSPLAWTARLSDLGRHCRGDRCGASWRRVSLAGLRRGASPRVWPSWLRWWWTGRLADQADRSTPVGSVSPPSRQPSCTRSAPTVVAITGSYGKTTTKGYVAHLCRGADGGASPRASTTGPVWPGPSTRTWSRARRSSWPRWAPTGRARSPRCVHGSARTSPSSPRSGPSTSSAWGPRNASPRPRRRSSRPPVVGAQRRQPVAGRHRRPGERPPGKKVLAVLGHRPRRPTSAVDATGRPPGVRDAREGQIAAAHGLDVGRPTWPAPWPWPSSSVCPPPSHRPPAPGPARRPDRRQAVTTGERADGHRRHLQRQSGRGRGGPGHSGPAGRQAAPAGGRHPGHGRARRPRQAEANRRLRGRRPPRSPPTWWSSGETNAPGVAGRGQGTGLGRWCGCRTDPSRRWPGFGATPDPVTWCCTRTTCPTTFPDRHRPAATRHGGPMSQSGGHLRRPIARTRREHAHRPAGGPGPDPGPAPPSRPSTGTRRPSSSRSTRSGSRGLSSTGVPKGRGQLRLVAGAAAAVSSSPRVDCWARSGRSSVRRPGQLLPRWPRRGRHPAGGPGPGRRPLHRAQRRRRGPRHGQAGLRGAVAGAGLPSLPRVLVSAGCAPPPTSPGPYIVKPRFGGSSIGIEVVADWADASSALVGQGSVH